MLENQPDNFQRFFSGSGDLYFSFSIFFDTLGTKILRITIQYYS